MSLASSRLPLARSLSLELSARSLGAAIIASASIISSADTEVSSVDGMLG